MGDNVRYFRICETVKDYGKYIPETENLFDHIKQDKPYYQSIYTYSKDQVEEAEKIIEVEKNGKKIKRPRGISGFTDVVTKKLVFDFDSKDISKSQKDANTIVDRLVDKGFKEDDLGIFFSGGKGFHVEVETDKLLTPHQAKSIAEALAKDLPTFDSVVYNPARIFRVPYTKHNSSGFYKTRLSPQELRENTVQEVLEIAKEAYEPEGLQEVHLPEGLLALASEKVEEKKPEVETNLEGDFSINLKNKPSDISNWKYALSQGLYKDGLKHYALMILAATYRGQGKEKEESYYLLKASADLQSKRFGSERVPKEPLWNIIEEVYSPLWRGGTYSEDNFPVGVSDFLEECGVPRFTEVEIDEDLVVDVDQGFKNFFDYAVNIDKNRLNFGIPSLDRLLKPQKGHLIGLLAGPGIGKCLGKDTPVMMADGSIKMVQDIKTGEELMGDDSSPRKVLSTCKGEDKLFKVTPVKGMSYVVNSSHILSLKYTSERSRSGFEKGKVYNLSISEYLDLPKSTRYRLKGYRVPVDFSENQTAIDPYMAGLWLGDGTRTKPEITTVDEEIYDYINEFANDGGYKISTYVKHGVPSYNIVTKLGQPNPFWNELKNFTENGEKFIPSNYLKNSRENRLKLLAGLIDSDGHLICNCYEYVTKDTRLGQDVLFLARSLGYAAYDVVKYVEGKPYHRVYISGNIDEVPVLLERKKASPRKQIKDVLVTGITVEELDRGEYYGFEIDGNHLFLLGDFTVTHNTSAALEFLTNTSKAGTKSLFGSYDMNSSILFQKLLQRETRLSDDEIYDVYRQGDEEKIEEFRQILAKHYSNVTFCFKVGQTIKDLKRTIAQREQVLGEKIGLVVVDYIELILSDKSDATQASAEAAQGLREIANSGKVVVVLLQPNKMSSKADEAPKTYNAAKGSSAIAQAVTSMMGCFRPGYNPEDPSMDKYFGVAILKNRMGPLGTCYFNWHGPTGRISEMEDIERQELDEFLKWKSDNKSDGDGGL